MLPKLDAGHYPILYHEQVCEAGENEIEGWWKFLDTPLGQYRPVPSARRFHMSRARYRHCLGGNRCLGPNTLIESPDGPARRVADITGEHRVWAWNGKQRVSAQAGQPWIKGEEKCLRIRLSTGESFDCSARHRVLTEIGWCKMSVAINFWLANSEHKRVAVLGFERLGVQPIYDFEVPGFHNYVTCGAIHHNSSKSESLVADVVLQCVDMHPTISRPNPVRMWYATKTFAMVGEYIYPKLEKYLTGWEHTWSWHSRIDKIPSSCRINNGHRDALIVFKAYEQGRDTFQGAGLDGAACDEQYGQDIYTEIVSRLDAARDFRFADALTPIDPAPWFEKKINGKAQTDTDIFYFPLDDNRISGGGFIPDHLIDAAIAEWPVEVQETRKNGRFGSFMGSIYQTFNRQVHVVAPEHEHLFLPRMGDNGERIIDPSAFALGGIDWGGANPFVFLWACRVPHMDDAWYVFDEYYWDTRTRGQRRLEEHAEEIKSRTMIRWRTALSTVYADHDPTDAFEMYGYGVPSTPADKAVKSGIEYVQTLFKLRSDRKHPWVLDSGSPRIFVAERCENLAEQIPSYHWSKGTAGKNAREEPAKINDHAVDTLRYIVFSDRHNSGDGGFGDMSALNADPENQRQF